MHERIKKLKIMNFRPFVVLSAFLMMAIFSAVFVSHGLRLVLFIVFISAFGIAFALTLAIKKKILLLITVILFSVSSAFGVIYSKSESLKNYQKYAGEDVYIYAKISENYTFTSSGNLALTLSDLQIKTGTESKFINGKIKLYTNPNNLKITEFAVGRYLTAKTNLTVFDLNGNFEKKKETISSLANGIIGYSYCAYYDIKLLDNYNVSARDYLCYKIKDRLDVANLQYSDLGFAMLFGESSYLDEDVKTEFRKTGIAHLLAVSGLHFSIIFMIVEFIAKITKANAKSNFIIQLIVVFIYCYLCKFSISVIRAGAMALIASYAKLRHKAYDNLSALSLVSFIILILNPLKLFNISFVLSFIAVFSILMLSPLLTRFFSNLLSDKTASALSLNLAVQFGMFAINIYYFGSYALFGGIVNLLLIPIATLGFGILFVSVILSSVCPLAIYLSKGFDFFIDIVVKMNGYFIGNGVYINLGKLSMVPVLLVVLLMVATSDNLLLKNRKKLITVAFFTILTGISFLL